MAKKRYRVVAAETVVHGHREGEEFEADLSEFNEEALIESGFLEVVGKSKPEKKEE